MLTGRYSPIRFELGGAHILWPRALGKLIRTKGMLSRERISAIERQLELALRRA
jgi:hypothetical protein